VRGIVLVICVGALLALASSAVAATAQVVTKTETGLCSKYSMCPIYNEVQFAGGSGEANVVTAQLMDTETIFNDSGTSLTAGQRCRQLDQFTAACETGRHILRLNDGDDRVTVDDRRSSGSAGSLAVHGDQGADLLTAGVHATLLNGGAGVDTLTGGPADDVLVDAGRGEADTYVGGGGKDTISYAQRRTAVNIALGAGRNEDGLTSLESVTGGRAGDTLIGNGAANVLAGAAGNDRLRGGSGRDTLEGDDGRDRVSGGRGVDQLVGGKGRDRLDGGSGGDALWLGSTESDDELEGSGIGPDGSPDSIRCGPGRDTVYQTDGADLVPADCERVEFDYFLLLGPPRRAGRGVVRIRALGGDDLSPRVLLYRGGRLFGRSHEVRRSGRVSIRLNRAGRRFLRKGMRVVLSDSYGETSYSARIH
jgi:hypothetical protein